VSSLNLNRHPHVWLSETDDESALQEVVDSEKSLCDLKVECGECWILEDLESTGHSDLASAAIAERLHMVAVIVQNRCTLHSEESWPCIPIHVDKSASVAEMKAIVISQIQNPPDVSSCRLRVDNDNFGLQPPLYEGMCIVDAGISHGSTIVLEPGIAPQASEVRRNFDAHLIFLVIPSCR
jgi:hypothetical protein